ncbi:hypothetical protein HQ571_02775 [Candidatus Kuenenbacteria bacterium]|nr:hypothetical protein [Candidatus Kuenenbacteria bacterium]
MNDNFENMPIEGKKDLSAREREDQIAERFEEVSTENKKLKEQLAGLESKTNSVGVFLIGESEKSPEKIQQVAENWKKRVREETAFFDSFDELGLDFFKEDLTSQPGFPDTKIIFSAKSEAIDSYYKSEGKVPGGLASRVHDQVDIGNEQPSLAHQLRGFLSAGRFDTSTETLLHEMIHRKHINDDEDVSVVLTESQAYFSGMLGGGKTTLKNIATTLSAKDGLYGFDADATIESLRAIAGLYALGKDSQAICDLVTAKDYKKFPMGSMTADFSKHFEQLAEAHGYDDVDEQSLVDIYRLSLENEAIKARLLLFDEVSKVFPVDEIIEKQKGNILQKVFSPSYSVDGVEFFGEEYGQYAIVPEYSEFCYNDDKKKVLSFGFFPEGFDEMGELSFDVAVLDIDKNGEAEVDFADNDEKKSRLLWLIKEKATMLPPKEKQKAFDLLYGTGGSSDLDKKIEVLQAFFEKDELIPLINAEKRTRAEFEGMIEGLNDYKENELSKLKDGEVDRNIVNEVKLKGERVIGYAENMCQKLSGIMAAYEISLSDLDSDLAMKYVSLKQKIAEVKELMKIQSL